MKWTSYFTFAFTFTLQYGFAVICVIYDSFLSVPSTLVHLSCPKPHSMSNLSLEAGNINRRTHLPNWGHRKDSITSDNILPLSLKTDFPTTPITYSTVFTLKHPLLLWVVYHDGTLRERLVSEYYTYTGGFKNVTFELGVNLSQSSTPGTTLQIQHCRSGRTYVIATIIFTNTPNPRERRRFTLVPKNRDRTGRWKGVCGRPYTPVSFFREQSSIVELEPEE